MNANPKGNTVACPCCHRKQPKRGKDAIYWCEHCQGQFDDDDEGIFAGYTDPQRNAEAKEEFEIRQRRREQQRRRNTTSDGRPLRGGLGR